MTTTTTNYESIRTSRLDNIISKMESLPVRHHRVTSPEYEYVYSYNTVIKRESSFMFETIVSRISSLGNMLENLRKEQISLGKEYDKAKSFRLNDSLECEYSYLEKDRLEKTSSIINIKTHKDSIKMYEKLNVHYSNVISSYERNIVKIESIKELISAQRTLLSKVKMSSSYEYTESHLIEKAKAVIVSVPVKAKKEKHRPINKIANPNSMRDYIAKNKVSKDKMVRHSKFDNKDARRISNLTNRNIIRIDSNGQYIKNNNISMPRVDADYNQNTLGSFDVNNNSFVAENEALYSEMNRFYSTPVNRADRSASVGTNKLNEVLRMNLQLLANSNNIIFFNGEERDLDSLKREELRQLCRDAQIPCFSTLNKGPLKDLIIKHFVTINGVLRRKTINPCSLEKMNELAKRIMDNIYGRKTFVRRVDVSEDKAGNVTYTITYQNIYGSRIAELFEVDEYTGLLPMGIEDDVTGEIVTAYEVPVGGNSGNILMKDLILVNIRDSKNCKFKSNNFSLVKDEDGKYSLEPITKDSKNEYTFVCTSTSMKKKSTFFAGEITENRTREDINNGIDKLTGGAYGYQLNKLLEEQRSGKKHVGPEKFAKLFDRIGLLVSTPMLYVGKTNNLFIYNDELDYGPQFSKSVEKFLNNNHIKVGRNFTDGYAVVGLDFIIKSIKETFGIELSYEEAMKLALQSRTTLITKKGLDRVFDKDMMFVKAKNIIQSINYELLAEKGLADPIVINIDGVRYYGQELQKMLINDLNKAKSILSKVDLLCTKDEAKMMNWDGLNNHACAEYYLVNVGKPTKANYSTQMLNKIALDFPEPTRKLMQMQARLSMWKFDDKSNKTLYLDKNQEISGSITSNLYAVNLDKAISDKLAATSNLYDVDKFGVSQTGKCNPKANSYYLKLSPFDSSLINFKLPKSLRSKEVEYINELGEVVKAKCNVIYSPEMNREMEENIIAICSDPNLTNREKVLMANSCRVVVAMKYPTQGTNEFTLCYCISKDELLEEITKVYGDAPTEEQKFNIIQMQKYVTHCPYSNVILFNDATMLVQDAGSDLDGDDGVFIVNELFTETLDNGEEKLHIGIFDDETKEAILGFISLCVKKVNEIGSICTVISRYSKTKELKKEALKNISTDTTEKINSYTEKKKASKAKNFKSSKNSSSNVLADNKKQVNLKDALEGRIYMSSDEFMKLDFIPSNVKITDFLGLYQACSVFGDDIGMTVILSSVIVNMPEENMFNADGTFNFELAKNLLMPLKIAVDDDTKVRITKPYVSVHRKDKNCFNLVNSSNINRIYYKMSDEEITEMYNQISALPETTTREEWKELQSDFSHLGRNLGETSIDIAKDASIANTYTIYDFVNKSYRLVGNMKPSYISSNIYKFISNKDNAYSLSYGNYKEEGVDNILPDAIGNIKHDTGRVFSEYINNIGYNLHDKSCYNYGCYGQYADIEIDEQLMLVLKTVLDYISDHSNPTFDLPKLDKTAIEILRKAVLNTVAYLGLDPSYAVKAMIKLAFLKNIKKTNKKGYVSLSSRSVNIDVDYNSRIKQVAKLFGEIFLAEYKDNNKNLLEVKLSYDLCTKDIPVGVPFKLINGYNEDKTFHTQSDYTGIAVAMEDGVYAIYNPYTKAMKNNNLVLIPISVITQDGEDDMQQGMTLRIGRDPKSQKIMIASTDKKKLYALSNMVCPEGLFAQELKNSYVYAYELDEDHHACFIVGELR